MDRRCTVYLDYPDSIISCTQALQANDRQEAYLPHFVLI
ncbi:hypothetical protein ABIE27_005441 [Paenibacillus sp. 4624]